MIDPEKAKANFRLACEQYDNAKALIKEMSSFVQVAQKDFSYEKAMRQFDLILQSVLLRTASEDGLFLDEEKQFIERITDYADLMSFVAQEHHINVTWDSFSALSSEDRKDISLKIFIELDDLVNNFVLPFAVVDAILPKDYCEELTKAMTLIGACLAGCDGDDTDSTDFKNETIVAFALIQKSIKEKWSGIVAKANQESSSSAEVKSGNRSSSLKDIYLKKNR